MSEGAYRTAADVSPEPSLAERAHQLFLGGEIELTALNERDGWEAKAACRKAVGATPDEAVRRLLDACAAEKRLHSAEWDALPKRSAR